MFSLYLSKANKPFKTANNGHEIVTSGSPCINKVTLTGFFQTFSKRNSAYRSSNQESFIKVHQNLFKLKLWLRGLYWQKYSLFKR